MSVNPVPVPETTPLPPHGVLPEFYGGAGERRDYINKLFDEAAPDYDWVSGVMSLWSDRFYRRDVLRRAGLLGGMDFLDVATGTGLMVRAAIESGATPERITGVDPSAGMLAQNRHHPAVTLREGIGEALPVAESSQDVVCIGYALRHVEDLNRLFAEFHRVLRPGGKLLILEIARPKSRWGLALLRFNMKTLLPRIAWLRRRNASTLRLMEYYWATIEACVPPDTILAAMQRAGFKSVSRKTTGPVLSEYLAER
jgi:demethylmenaquinone methyltransferase / 2-methoxy-6-polyprenyl-1,4-benzoquinol methylase